MKEIKLLTTDWYHFESLDVTIHSIFAMSADESEAKKKHRPKFQCYVRGRKFSKKKKSYHRWSNETSTVDGFDKNLHFWKKIHDRSFLRFLREDLSNKQTNKSRFSWCRRTGAREAVLLFTRRCWQPLRNLFPHSLHYGTMFATNWSSNGELAAEASVTCRRSQWSNSSHFFFALFSTYAFFLWHDHHS